MTEKIPKIDRKKLAAAVLAAWVLLTLPLALKWLVTAFSASSGSTPLSGVALTPGEGREQEDASVTENLNSAQTPPPLVLSSSSPSSADRLVQSRSSLSSNHSYPATPVAGKLYKVQRGDNLLAIAETAYGDREKWIQLAAWNHISDVTRIATGLLLEIPELRRLEQPFAVRQSSLPHPYVLSQVTWRTVKVKPGDTLSKLAEQEYRDIGRTMEVAAFNGLRDQDKITEGELVRMPTAIALSRTPSITFNIAFVQHHQRLFADAISGFESFLSEADSPLELRTEARFLQGMSALRMTDTVDWFWANDPIGTGDPRHELLLKAEGYFQQVVQDYPSTPFADEAQGWIHGIEMRLGKLATALQGYVRMSGESREGTKQTSIDWCLMALTQRMKTLTVEDREIYLKSLTQLGRFNEVFAIKGELLQNLSWQDLIDIARPIDSDEKIAALFFGASMGDVPLRVQGVNLRNLDPARRTVEWLSDAGQTAECIELGAIVWSLEGEHTNTEFASSYVRALIQAGRASEALRVACEAGLSRARWALIGNGISLAALEDLIATPPEWLQGLRELKYARALRLYAALRFEEAQAYFFQMVREDPADSYATFALVRLAELDQVVRDPAAYGLMGTARDLARLDSTNLSNLDQAGLDLKTLIGPEVMSPSQLHDLAEQFLAYDELENELVRGSPNWIVGSHAITLRLEKYLLASLFSSYFQSLPAPTRGLIQRTAESVQELGKSTWNHQRPWKRFAYVQASVIPQFARDRDCSSLEDFRERVGPVLDVSWNLMRIISGFRGDSSSSAAWFSRGQYYEETDPFLQPGRQSSDKEETTWTATVLGWNSAEEQTRLRGASTRLARHCYQKANAPDRDEKTLWRLAECNRTLADLIYEEHLTWRYSALMSLKRAGLVDRETAKTLDDVVPPVSLRRLMPRWELYDSYLRAAIIDYRGVAEQGGNLADDAFRIAGDLANRGLGSTEEAIDYFNAGVLLDGDQRPLLELMRDSLSKNRRVDSAGISALAVLWMGTQARAAPKQSRDFVEVWPKKDLGPYPEDTRLGLYIELRVRLADARIDEIPDLLARLFENSWADPMVPYLMECWYEAALSPEAKAQMASILAEKLGSEDFGPSRFYVHLLRARLQIDLGEFDAARESLAETRRENPFRENTAIRFESLRLSRATGVVESGSEEISHDVAYYYVGNHFVPASEALPR